MAKIVSEDEAKFYICPLMNGKPCEGRSCMLWRQNFKIDKALSSTRAVIPPKLIIDEGKGYCGAGK